MGTNRWHAEKDWPLPGTRFTKLYLASSGNPRKRDGDGRLDLSVPKNAASSDYYRYDPKDPPELGMDFTDLSHAWATKDHADGPDRDDTLEYTSPPLAEPCEVVGPMKVVLWVSTDAKDTDLGVVIYRLTSEGKLFLVRGGLQRLRYANNPRVDSPVLPGTKTRVEIDCGASALRLNKGDRLLLRVLSSLWPFFARNLNTLEPQDRATEAVIATNTIYHNTKHPSHLLLPVVPRPDATGLRFAKERLGLRRPRPSSS